MPIETVIRPILDTVLDAVVVMDRAGVIRAWNHHAEAMFGWTADEAIGRDLGDLIVPPALREGHHRGLARFNAEGVGRVLDTRLELFGLRRDNSEIPVELSITLVSREGRDAFVGFLRDVSERRRAEQQLEFRLRESRLMLDLSERASREESFDEVLAATLDSICSLADWPLGHAFVVAEDDFRLVSSAWSANARELAPDLVEATESEAFAAGIGLPGEVLASRQPLWVAQVGPESNFPRRGMGFESGFAFPVFSADRCIAVLEFFSRDPREPDPALLLTARAIGAQIGRVHERKRGADLQALLLAELNHRAKNILSVVRGIAHLSFGTSNSLEDARRTFDRRLDSIAKANDILHAQSGKNALLSEIVREALDGCGAPADRVTTAGPHICVDSSTAIMFSLAVHELCTNALKYGALSSEDGRIELGWSLPEEDTPRFDFSWTEAGGPPVTPPTSQGFGMRILKRGMELETGGRAEVAYQPEGFAYRLRNARHSGVADDRAAACA
jgi:PAS domain S-box-containing protein